MRNLPYRHLIAPLVLLALLALGAAPAAQAADLLVAANQVYTLPPGSHVFDNVTIEGGATLYLIGDTMLTVNANFTLLGTGAIDGRGTTGADGAAGTDGLDNGDSGSPGFSGAAGGDGYTLTLNIMGDCFIAGELLLRGGDGGDGGKGGQGLTGRTPAESNGYAAPTPGGNGALGGSGGKGGNGGHLKLVVAGALQHRDGDINCSAGWGGNAGAGGDAGAGGSGAYISSSYPLYGAKPPGMAGAAGRAGEGGAGGSIEIWAGDIRFSSAREGEPSLVTTRPTLRAEGGLGGDGARGGHGGSSGHGATNGTYCTSGTPPTTFAFSSAGAAGGDGGAIWVHSACGVQKWYLYAEGALAGDGPEGAKAGDSGLPCGGTTPCPVCVNGLDAENAPPAGDGGKAGRINVVTGAFTPGYTLELYTRGGNGGDGHQGHGGAGPSANMTAGAPGDGGDGGNGADGGKIILRAGTYNPAMVTNVNGGAGGAGGVGGKNLYYPDNREGQDGTPGTAGAAGTLSMSNDSSPLKAMLSVDLSEASWGDTLTYHLSVAATTGQDNLTLTLPTPANTVALEATPGFALNGDVFSWTIAHLDPCKVQVVSLKVRVNNGLGDGTVLSNQGQVVSSQTASQDSNPAETTIKLQKDPPPPVDPDNTLGGDSSHQPGPDPVHPGTGNFYFSRALFGLPGKGGLPLVFRVTYNALDHAYLGPLGYGWTHSYNLTVTENATTGEVSVKWDDGHVDHFQATGTKHEPVNSHTLAELTDLGAAGWQVETPQKIIYNFNAAGQLTSITDPVGHNVALTYTSGKLTRLTDTGGRQANLTYSGSRLTGITAPGYTAAFAYSGSQDLTRLTLPGGASYQFAYDGSHRLVRLTDRRGHTALTQRYDAADRVVQQTDALGGKTTYAYDDAARTTVITVPSGRQVTHYYDQAYNLAALEDGNGNSAVFSYNNQGQPTTRRDKLGAEDTFTYDPSGNCISYQDRSGRTQEVTYNAGNNQLQTVTDPWNHQSVLNYDNQGNLTSIEDPLGKSTTFDFNASGQITAFTNRLNKIWQFSFNAAGLVDTVTDPLGRVTQVEYDSAGRSTRVVFPDTSEVNRVYDAAGNLTRETDPLGGVLNYTYDAAGNLTRRTIAATGASTSYTYDALNRVTRITNPLGGVTTYTYDADGNLIGNQDPDGVTLGAAFDAGGRLTTQTDPSGGATTFAYDADGRLIKETTPLGYSWQFTYDAQGRRTKVTDPLGHVATTSYDLAGRISSETDAAGRRVRYSYDALNRITVMTLPDGGKHTYAYDAEGHLTTHTDPAGRVWRFAYDALGRVTQRTDPAGGVETYTYDAKGLVASQTDRRGVVATYTYDAKGRLTACNTSAGQNLAFTYDAAGNTTQIQDNGGATTQTFDLLGRRTSLTDPRGKALTWTYTAAGRVKTLTYPGNKTLTYTYNSAGLLTRLTDWRGGVTSFTYDLAGQPTQVTLPNQTSTTYAYDGAGRLMGLYHRDAAGTLLRGYTLERDVLGRTIGVRGTGDSEPPAATETRQMTYNAAGRLTKAAVGSAVTNYTYDASGNLTGKSGAQTAAYTYDGLNRLSKLVTGGATYNYTYDWQGRLLSRNQGSQTSYQLRLGRFLYCTYDQTGQVDRYYISQGALLYSLGAAAGDYRIYHGDPSGNVLAVSNASGAVVQTYAYDPYGRVSAATGNLDDPCRFLGLFGVRSEAGGLYLMGARFYDPQSGRFLSEDPLGPEAGTNLYQYAGSDPVNSMDPSGLQPQGNPPVANIATEKNLWKFFRWSYPEKSYEYVESQMDYYKYGARGSWRPLVDHTVEDVKAFAERGAYAEEYAAWQRTREALAGTNYYATGSTAVEDYLAFNGLYYQAAAKGFNVIKYSKVNQASFYLMERGVALENHLIKTYGYETASAWLARGSTALTWGGRALGALGLIIVAKDSYEAGESFSMNVLFYDEETGRAVTFDQYYLEAWESLEIVRNFLQVPVDPQTYMYAKKKYREELEAFKDELNRVFGKFK
ncbi:MAG: hypothetical protein KQJ78_07520 [Deltaproteobacteria bacterium]|nr:hypothetical protein [Deltaproteobacteria bacterium]